MPVTGRLQAGQWG